MLLRSLLALAVAGLAAHPSLRATAAHGGGPINYEANAVPLPKVLEDLGRVSGTKLACAADLKEDRLVVHFEAVTLDSALEKLAWATYGEWEKTADGLSLKRSAAAIEKNAAQAQAERVKAIAGCLDVMRRNLQSQGTFDSAQAHSWADRLRKLAQLDPNNRDYAEKDRIEQAAPLNRAIDGALLAVGAEELGRIPVNSSRVYSDAPNAVQIQLPADALEPIKRLTAEQRVWSDAVAGIVPADGDPLLRRASSLDGDLVGQVGHVLLQVNRSGSAPDLRASLKLYQTSGELLATVTEYLDPGAYPVDITAKTIGRASEPKPNWVAIDPKVHAAVHIFQAGGVSFVPKELALIQDSLFRPAEVDPLALVYGSSLLAMARQHHESLVAFVIDDLLAGGGYSVQGFDENPFRQSGSIYTVALDSKLEDGWCAIRPKDLKTTLSHRFDRESLQNAVTEAVSKRQISLDRIADFAYRNPDPTNARTLQAYLLGVDPSLGGNMFWNDWKYLRFYGSLTPEQRASTQVQSFRDLSQDQLAILASILFDGVSALHNGNNLVQTNEKGEPIHPAIQVANQPGASPHTQMIAMMRAQQRFRDALANQPTALLPQGLTASGYFQLSSTAMQEFVTNRPAGNRVMVMRQPANFGGANLFNPTVVNGQRQSSGPVRLATARDVLIKIVPARQTLASNTLSEWRLDPKLYTNPEDLPEPLRSQVLADIKQMASNTSNSVRIIGGGASTGPAKP